MLCVVVSVMLLDWVCDIVCDVECWMLVVGLFVVGLLVVVKCVFDMGVVYVGRVLECMCLFVDIVVVVVDVVKLCFEWIVNDMVM